MGFFSKLLKGIGAVAGAVLNPAGAVAGLFGASKTQQAALAPALPGLTALSAVGTPVKALIAAPTLGSAQTSALAARAIGSGVSKGVVAAVGTSLVMRGAGNGQFSKQTIVETINLDTGLVVKRIILDGAPFLMNKEVASLARVTRKLGKASRKIPRRTVKQSLGAQLTEKVLSQTINDVGHPHHSKC